MSNIATAIYVLLILGLFWLDRDPKARTSSALWIPVIWLSLAGSRSVAEWLRLGPQMVGTDQYLEGNPINRVVYTGLLAVALAVLISRWRHLGKLLRANRLILVFFLYCAASILWSDYPDVAFKRWHKAAGDLFMVLIVLSDREPYTAVKRLLARTTFFLIPLSILLIKYYPHLGRAYARDWTTVYVGVTTNKNALGVICLLCGLASVWRFVTAYQERKSTGRNRQLIAHGAILLMIVWLFRHANSMTSLSCILLAGAVLLGAHMRAVVRRPVVLQIFIAAGVSASASVLFLGLGPGLLQAMGRDPTLTDRTEIWSLIFTLTNNPLFGTGFESFWLGPRLDRIWALYTWGPNEAHNGYIEIYLSLGWMGVALLAFVLATGYKTVVAGFRRRLPTASLMLAYFVTGVVYNFTEAAFFRMMAPPWILFLLAITRVPQPPRLKMFKPRVDFGFATLKSSCCATF